MTEEAEQHPERMRLMTLVEMAEKRRSRADEKIRAAQCGLAASIAGLTAARGRLAAWDEANPDPQLSLI